MQLLGREYTNRELVLLGATLLVGVFFGLKMLGQNLSRGSMSPGAIQQEVDAATQKLLASQQRIAKTKKTYHLGTFRLPATQESPKVLSHIDQLAQEVGLEFSSITATVPKKGKGIQTITFRFMVTGNMNQIVEFIDRLQSGDYLVCVETWDMKQAKDPKKVVATLSLRAYFEIGGSTS